MAKLMKEEDLTADDFINFEKYLGKEAKILDTYEIMDIKGE